MEKEVKKSGSFVLEYRKTTTSSVEISTPCYVVDLDGGGIYTYKVIDKENAIQILNASSSVGISKVHAGLAFSTSDYKFITEEEYNDNFNKAIMRLKSYGN